MEGGFELQLARARQRLAELAEHASGQPSGSGSDLVDRLVGELTTALEELAVTGAALSTQTTRAEQNERRYADLFDLAPDGYLVTDRNGMVREVNKRAAAMLEGSVPQLYGHPLTSLVQHSDHAPLRDAVARLRAGADRTSVEVTAQTVSGNTFAASLHAVAERQAGPHGEQLVTVRWALRDERERQQMHETLVHQATHDSLTGLINREHFLARLQEEIDEAARDETSVGVLFCDLDRFKDVNDRLGHDGGDELLKAVAGRLRGLTRQTDLLTRLGGDEFALACPRLRSESELVHLANRILRALSGPFALANGRASVTGSIGIAQSQPSSNASELLGDADHAMYFAKRTGRNRYQIFDESIHASVVHRLDVEDELSQAIERGALSLHYQPVVDLRDGQPVMLEALVRWSRHGGEVVSAGEFISIAEQSGLVVPIGEWVLTQAVADLDNWQEAGLLEHLRVSVNLSAEEIGHPEFLTTVRQALARGRRVTPAHLCLELSEKALRRNGASGGSVEGNGTLAQLRELREMDVKIAVDQFGMDYASVALLRDLPVDMIKIDRSYVSGLGATAVDRLVLSAVLGISDARRHEAVAHGVEKPEHVHALLTLGCTLGQGFHLAEPRSVADTTTALERRWRATLPTPTRRAVERPGNGQNEATS